MKLVACKIQLKAFQMDIMDEAYKQIKDTVSTCQNLSLSGFVYLPTKITKITVNRSPHIDKKSREQFETRMHTRVIHLDLIGDVGDSFEKFLDTFKKMIFFGLNIKVVFTYNDRIVL